MALNNTANAAYKAERSAKICDCVVLTLFVVFHVVVFIGML